MNERAVQNFFKFDYHDCGIKKWQGYFLSDHTSKLSKLRKQKSEQQQRKLDDQMDRSEIDEVLQKSFANRLKVELQYAYYDKNELKIEQIIGTMKGYYKNLVIVGDQILRWDEIVSAKLIK